MNLSKILKKKSVVSQILTRKNAKSEMLRVAKELNTNGYEYLIFSDNCLELAKNDKGFQNVIYLEIFNNSLYLSKYRYGKETKLRIARIFSKHKHTTISLKQ